MVEKNQDLDPRILELGDTASRLCRTVAEIHAHGWCLGTSGNFSVTLGGEPRQLLITQSGRDKRRVEIGDLVIVDEDGAAVAPADGKPSAETLLHCTLARHGAGATLHTHSVAGTLLGERYLAAGGFMITGYEMLKGLAGVTSHEERVWVPVVANRQDMTPLSAELEELLRRHAEMRGFLIAGHGLYTWGATLEDAQRQVEIFEFLFEVVARRDR